MNAGRSLTADRHRSLVAQSATPMGRYLINQAIEQAPNVIDIRPQLDVARVERNRQLAVFDQYFEPIG